LVATGIEATPANTGRLVLALEAARSPMSMRAASSLTNKDGKKKEYRLQGLTQTNQNSAFLQRPSVHLGDKVKKGDVLADALLSPAASSRSARTRASPS
jgi:DNA-directed RNA polymerase beta subunit